jgi:hypothetical protein
VDVYVAGAKDWKFGANSINILSGTTLTIDSGATITNSGTASGFGSADPASADGDTLGTASLEWSDLYLADSGVIYFGNDQDITLTHVPDTGLILGGTTPTLTIGDAGAEDTKIVFDGNAQDFHIGLDDTSDDLVIGLGSALGTTTHMAFDEAGTVTMPLQPAFMIYKSSAQDDININTTITWETERFDVNGDFASNTFTAPVTGKYLMAVHIRWDAIPADGEYTCLNIITSNYSYQYVGMVAHTGFDATQLYHSSSFTGVVDMDASDTCYVQHQGQTSTVDVSVSSYFSGMLIG